MTSHNLLSRHFTYSIKPFGRISTCSNFTLIRDKNKCDCTWKRLHLFRDTEIQRYRDTEIQRYRDTEIQRYRDTEIQRYKDTASISNIKQAGTGNMDQSVWQFLVDILKTTDQKKKKKRKKKNWSNNRPPRLWFLITQLKPLENSNHLSCR